MKTIWIINQYSSTPQTGTGGRHHYLARELAKRGHRVYVIAARWHHLLHDTTASDAAPFIEEIDGYSFVRINMPRYSGAHSKRRILNWFLFAWRISRLKAKEMERPDTILYSSPSLIGFWGAERLAKRLAAKLVFEVRDIWPLSLVDLGGYKASHPFIRLLQRTEDRAYHVSDRVVSNLPNAVDHMVERGMDPEKFAWVPNGFSLDEVKQKIEASDEVLEQIPDDKFVVGYTGTIGLANSLETMVSAAELLKDHKDIAFIIVGNGNMKETLQTSVGNKKLGNISFLPPVRKIEIQSVLARFDACYYGLSNTPIYKYGIALNKLFDYLYSAKPIISSYSGGVNPVIAHDCGISVEAENPAKLAKAILELRNTPKEQRRKMGKSGKEAALKYYEFGILAEKLEAVLLGDQSASET